jgi:hypothetical protein
LHLKISMFPITVILMVHFETLHIVTTMFTFVEQKMCLG